MAEPKIVAAVGTATGRKGGAVETAMLAAMRKAQAERLGPEEIKSAMLEARKKVRAEAIERQAEINRLEAARRAGVAADKK